MKENIVKDLFEIGDIEYKNFQCKLMPTVDMDTVIGVRMPDLRKYVAELNKNGDLYEFINDLPHQYYEENNIHGIVINNIKNYEECIASLNAFLPYVNNWATCDLISPSVFKSHTDILFEEIKKWLMSDHVYTVRFAVKTLMTFYSFEYFSREHLDMVSRVESQDYYIKMAVSWYFATELAFNYDDTKIILEERRLDKWVHNKTIQKALESYRICDENKCYLKRLKIK